MSLILRLSTFAVLLGAAISSHALTIYRIGGHDLPHPELDASYEFVQLAWDEIDSNLHGHSELISLTPERISPQNLDPSINLTPMIEELGGRIMILEWNGWQQWRDDDIFIFDGDQETAYLGDGHYLRVAGYGPQSKYWVFDFGGRFFIDRMRFYPRERFASTRFVENFKVGISDGDPLKDGTREYVVSWRNSSLDFDIIHDIRENTEPNMVLSLPPEPIQQLFIELPENNRGIWEIAEFEIFAAGPAARASYASNIIDLGSPAVLGDLTWGGQLEAGARVELSVRSGDDDDPNTYWRATFRGAERTRLDENGKPLTLRSYNRLQKGSQAGVTPDTEDWTFWSVPFNFAQGRGQLPGDRLRRYAQFRAEFHSTADAVSQLDYLQFSASVPPPASEAIAEITPTRAVALTPTQFTFKLVPHLTSNDLGFDHLAIDTPTRAQEITAVRIGGVPVDFDITRLDDRGFEVALPRMDHARTGELIEVDFRTEVFAYSTVFSGRVRDSTRPLEIAQPVTPGDADRFDEAANLTVDLLDLDQPLIGNLTLHPQAFTPNGDGINDAIRVEYDLLYLVEAIAVDLQIFDLSGRQVGRPYRGQATSGRFAVEWDGTDAQGSLLPPGIYLVRLTAETDRGAEQRQRQVSLAY